MIALSALHLGVWEKRQRKNSYQSAILIAASRSFVLELLMCLWSIFRYSLSRPESDTGDVVAIYCGFGFIPGERSCWHGDTLTESGMGGSEQCVVRLARALGRSQPVVVYNSCQKKMVSDGVTYRPTADFNPWNAYAHLIVWRLPQFFLAQSMVSGLMSKKSTTFQCSSLSFWIHDGSNLEILRRSSHTFRFAIARALRLATDIVFPSREMLDAQRTALYGSQSSSQLQFRTLTIPHGLPRVFSSKLRRRPCWMLWPVSVERGLDEVLSRLDDMQEACADPAEFRLFVCHHKHGYHKFFNAAEDPRVVFTGMLPPNQLAVMYKVCSIFVFPSRVPEAFSLSLWECMTHGVVPVAYGLGALASLGQCGALIVPPGDQASLTFHACSLLRDHSYADRVRDHMLKRVKERARNWDEIARIWQATVFRSADIPRTKAAGKFVQEEEHNFKCEIHDEAWILQILDRHDAARGPHLSSR